MDRMFVDVHVIQTIPPSCVNRDDTGSPKTCIYGGVRRARVSSQSWKHAVREQFTEQFDASELGFRTKRVAEIIARHIKEMDPDAEDPDKKATEVLDATGLTKGKKDNETAALFFISDVQAKNLAELAISGTIDKKSAKKILGDGTSMDIALFGRMVADDASLNTDACCQVAHAISTHAVSNEYDYFTAVDDMSKDNEPGAGMIGTIEYNSSTLYRYATVAVHAFERSLEGNMDAAIRGTAGFIHAFITAMPTGKMNTFANRTVPDSVMICVRHDQPVNLSGAFEAPVKNDGSGYSKKSSERLFAYNEDVCSTFLAKPAKVWCIGSIGSDQISLDGALSELETFMRGEL